MMEQGMLNKMMVGESIFSLPATYNKENASGNAQRQRQMPIPQPRQIPYLPPGISSSGGGGFVNAGIEVGRVEGVGHATQSSLIDSHLQDLIRSHTSTPRMPSRPCTSMHAHTLTHKHISMCVYGAKT
jgi:hypothetical protein